MSTLEKPKVSSAGRNSSANSVFGNSTVPNSTSILPAGVSPVTPFHPADEFQRAPATRSIASSSGPVLSVPSLATQPPFLTTSVDVKSAHGQMSPPSASPLQNRHPRGSLFAEPSMQGSYPFCCVFFVVLRSHQISFIFTL
jgi:hypothetical protein